jgi:hypothetical protein
MLSCSRNWRVGIAYPLYSVGHVRINLFKKSEIKVLIGRKGFNNIFCNSVTPYKYFVSIRIKQLPRAIKRQGMKAICICTKSTLRDTLLAAECG